MALDEFCRGNRNILTAAYHQLGFRIALLRSLRLILRRVWPRAFVLENLSEITAIDPATAGRAADEMIDLVLGRIADAPDRLPEAAARGQGQAARLGVRPLVLDRAAAHCFPVKERPKKLGRRPAIFV